MVDIGAKSLETTYKDTTTLKNQYSAACELQRKYEIICMTGTGDIGRRHVEWRRNANIAHFDC